MQRAARHRATTHCARGTMKYDKNYDCHKQKYYVPQTKPSWAILNLKQASKKIKKEQSVATKQTLRYPIRRKDFSHGTSSTEPSHALAPAYRQQRARARY